MLLFKIVISRDESTMTISKIKTHVLITQIWSHSQLKLILYKYINKTLMYEPTI